MEIQLLIAIAGAAGGLIKSLVEQNGKVLIPSIEISKDANGATSKYIHLGFLFNVILGAIVSFYTMTTPLSAFTAGVSSAFFAEKLIERTPVVK